MCTLQPSSREMRSNRHTQHSTRLSRCEQLAANTSAWLECMGKNSTIAHMADVVIDEATLFGCFTGVDQPDQGMLLATNEGVALVNKDDITQGPDPRANSDTTSGKSITDFSKDESDDNDECSTTLHVSKYAMTNIDIIVDDPEDLEPIRPELRSQRASEVDDLIGAESYDIRNDNNVRSHATNVGQNSQSPMPTRIMTMSPPKFVASLGVENDSIFVSSIDVLVTSHSNSHMQLTGHFLRFMEYKAVSSPDISLDVGDLTAEWDEVKRLLSMDSSSVDEASFLAFKPAIEMLISAN